jgi:hypothetical protein
MRTQHLSKIFSEKKNIIKFFFQSKIEIEAPTYTMHPPLVTIFIYRDFFFLKLNTITIFYFF